VARNTALPAPTSTASPTSSKPAHVQAPSEMARPRLELGTPRFSGTRRNAGKGPKSPANRRVADRARCAVIPVVAGSCPRLKDVAPVPRPFRPRPRGRYVADRVLPLREPGIEFSNPTRSMPRRPRPSHSAARCWTNVVGENRSPTAKRPSRSSSASFIVSSLSPKSSRVIASTTGSATTAK
jgi:hypothetical protein